MLSVLDRKWREHLYEMDYLREGIYLRAYSQRDPLVEYQREGFDMFAAMMDGIKEESVGFLFNLEVEVEDDDEDDEVQAERSRPGLDGHAADRLRAGGGPRARCPAAQQPHQHAPQHPGQGPRAAQPPQNLSYSAPVRGRRGRGHARAGSPTDDPYAGVGRNAQCPCGSGKKYKQCHGAPGGATGRATMGG